MMDSVKILFSVTFCLITALASDAQVSAHRQLAGELLNIIDVKDNIEATRKEIYDAQREQIARIHSEDKAELIESQQKILDFIAAELSWEKLESDYIQLYMETFTEGELEKIVAFYRTPAGKKYLQQNRPLIKKSVKILQKKIETIMPHVNDMIRKTRDGKNH